MKKQHFHKFRENKGVKVFVTKPTKEEISYAVVPFVGNPEPETHFQE